MSRPVVTSEQAAPERAHQGRLFPVRVAIRFPGWPVGQDLAFVCQGDDGEIYYAKADSNGRPTRATEWICTNLANGLSLSAADCVVLESDSGETFFGSRQPTSLADEWRCDQFLRTPSTDELGRPSQWKAQYLARLWAFDTFFDNPDRSLRNFVLDGTGRLRAIDFASARFVQRPDTKFPIASENTSIVGKLIREIHGSQNESAFELLDRLGATALSTIEGIVRAMPPDWLTEDQMGGFVEVWSNDRHKQRVSDVKALIEHGWDL